VAESLERFGARYLERVFTPHEIECCSRADARTRSRAPGYSVESLAARFAAKEATLKVLRPVGWRPDWRSIEVRRTSGGWCEIHLSGRAATLAADAGIDELEVSLTHESMVAVAVVVGRCVGAGGTGGHEPDDPTTQGDA
jgi:holo-[acyl-carrier protein] synthase